MEHLAPKKALGQNFLVDRNIAGKIVEALAPGRGELVVEIGPGQGALTRLLVERGARVTAIEVDPRMAERIVATFGGSVEVLREDVLQCDLTALAHARGVGRMRVIGNIPYYITSPILFHLVDHRSAVAEAVLMMQREVAMRLVAVPRTKDYGILAVMTQSYARASRLFTVGPRCFAPPPKVTSAVVRLVFDQRAGLAGIEREHRVMVRTAFNQRRKTLRNALSQLIPHDDARTELFERAAIDPSARAEELTVDDFIRLARAHVDADRRD